MSVHDKLVEHAFRRGETHEHAPTRSARYSEFSTVARGDSFAASGSARSSAAAGAPPANLRAHAPELALEESTRSPAGQPFAGGQPPRSGAFRRVAVVVRASC